MLEGKKITLGGKEYLIPELAIRQRRVVFPLVIKVAPRIHKLILEENLHKVTTEDLDDMIEVVYQGVNRGLSHITRESFLDLVFDVKDLIPAFDVVASQAGFEAEEERPKLPGEMNGEETTPSPSETGTSTSTT